MEQRIISYTKGITRSPGELIAEDGELLECINLKCEGGELKPLLWPELSDFMLKDGEELLYIHHAIGYKSYFVGSDSTVNAFLVTADGTRKDYAFSHTFKGTVKFESIGNTVIVVDGDGLHYILYKNSDYIYLGQHFPECPLSFGLQGELKYYSKVNGLFKVSFAEEIGWGDYYTKPFTDSNKKAVTEQVLAKVNQFIKEESTDKGRFMFPFLVRYAYRLYDGTLTYHSAPVLMVASSYPNPYVPVLGNLTEGDGEPKSGAVCDVVGVASQLDYALLDESVKETLRNWGDIIKSVDVFVSAPIYSYNQNGSIERFVNVVNENGATNALYLSDAAFVGKIVGGDRPDGKDFSGFPSEDGVTNGSLLSDYYQRWNIVELYQSLRRAKTGQLYAELPLYDRSVTDESVKSCSQFYFLKSIKASELSTARTIIPVESNYFQSLQSRELMSDDYRSHDRISSESVYVYNGRLNMYGINRELFSGWNPATLYQYTNGAVDVDLDAVDNVVNPTFTDVSSSYCGDLSMQTLVGESGEVWFPVQSTTGQNFDLRETGLYTFFPNIHAIGFLVGGIVSSGPYFNYSGFNFESHRFLNGAVHFFGLGRRVGSSVQLKEKVEVPVLSEPGKIYTSEVNNPFVFSAGGVNTVGTGDIIGIVSTTKALSQGQFGQFPLLVLSTDGIWAMAVNDDGLYSAKQVISRDVCNNADSIVQTDNLVFFSSERGLLAVDGANVVCVTEHMKGVPGTVQSLKCIDNILDKDEYKFVLLCDDGKEFKDFLKGCRIGYNYRDNTLYISNKEYAYLYVYDIRQGTFTKLCSADESSKVIGFVNDYPDTLMQESVTIKSTDDKGKEVVSQKTNVYSMIADHDLSTTEPSYGFAMTRALKLGNPTGMKRIRQLKNLKNVVDADNYVKYALWGSNDGILWYNIRSYDGGFKYYRMGLFTKLAPSESVLGSVMAVEEKRNNKMR